MRTKLAPAALFGDEDFRKTLGAVAMTKGVYDLTHAGHVRSLQAARSLGDSLVVGLATDESVRQAKGAGRPVLSFEERVEILSAFACVDYVVAYDVGAVAEVVHAVRPSYLCASRFTFLSAAERADLESLGTELCTVERPPVRSTSDLIASILDHGKARS